MITLERLQRSRRWLQNWLYTRLSLSQGTLRLIAIDFSSQHKLDADPKAIQQVNFTANLKRNASKNLKIFFITEETKEAVFDFSKGTVKVLRFYFF